MEVCTSVVWCRRHWPATIHGINRPRFPGDTVDVGGGGCQGETSTGESVLADTQTTPAAAGGWYGSRDNGHPRQTQRTATAVAAGPTGQAHARAAVCVTRRARCGARLRGRGGARANRRASAGHGRRTRATRRGLGGERRGGRAPRQRQRRPRDGAGAATKGGGWGGGLARAEGAPAPSGRALSALAPPRWWCHATAAAPPPHAPAAERGGGWGLNGGGGVNERPQRASEAPGHTTEKGVGWCCNVKLRRQSRLTDAEWTWNLVLGGGSTSNIRPTDRCAGPRCG